MKTAKTRGLICLYCDEPVGGKDIGKDHILPRSRGGTFALQEKLGNNKRLVHKNCNYLREHAGDCIGALFCARAVTEDIGRIYKRSPMRRVRKVLQVWRLMYGARIATPSEVTEKIPRRLELGKTNPSSSKRHS